MLNSIFESTPLSMTPEGSLNHLAIDASLLPKEDPLRHEDNLLASQMVSRQAFVHLLQSLNHPLQDNLRGFLTQFTADNSADYAVFSLFAHRFAAVINTARAGQHWRQGSPFQQALAAHWHDIQTLVISGGLTSHQFGIQLATTLEELVTGLAVITSPWGGLTALYGLAQTYASHDDLLVLDFGATGIKRGIAHKYGNHIEMLPDLKVKTFKHDGLIRAPQLQAILQQTREILPHSMPVAISLACYMNNGHPHDYHSGIYHRLGEDCEHLQTQLHHHWLPDAGYFGLALLEHDSTAAALAFQFRQPAMMVTLGTGLGSAPCPRV